MCASPIVIFYLFLVAAINLSNQLLKAEDGGIQIQFHLDGNFFNIRHLQCKTKTTICNVQELQYAGDCALLAHSPTSILYDLNFVSSVYYSLGLQINNQKTEVIVQESSPSPTPPKFTTEGTLLKIVQHF